MESEAEEMPSKGSEDCIAEESSAATQHRHEDAKDAHQTGELNKLVIACRRIVASGAGALRTALGSPAEVGQNHDLSSAQEQSVSEKVRMKNSASDLFRDSADLLRARGAKWDPTGLVSSSAR